MGSATGPVAAVGGSPTASCLDAPQKPRELIGIVQIGLNSVARLARQLGRPHNDIFGAVRCRCFSIGSRLNADDSGIAT